jgi:hypothetical protein
MKVAHGLDRADSVGLFAMRLQTYFTAFVVNAKIIVKLSTIKQHNAATYSLKKPLLIYKMVAFSVPLYIRGLRLFFCRFAVKVRILYQSSECLERSYFSYRKSR